MSDEEKLKLLLIESEILDKAMEHDAEIDKYREPSNHTSTAIAVARKGRDAYFDCAKQLRKFIKELS